MSGGGRRLQDDERALWKGVTRSIKPLKPRVEPGDEPAAVTAAPRKTSGKPKPAFVPVVPPKPTASRLPALAPLGRRAKQRLARGSDSIDGRLDMHGRTQAQAHSALLNFLRSAQQRGAKNVLVITGKGARESEGERGVLKRQVPLWLRLPEFRGVIVGFESAGIGHGGEGALYVRLRRLRPD